YVDITLSIIWTLVLANIFGALACILLTKQISKIALIPGNILVPILLVILTVGAYQSTRHWGDIVLFFCLGVIGWLKSRLDWSIAALFIGIVHSTSVERYLWISRSRYGFEWLTNPGVIIIGISIILVIVSGAIMYVRERKKEVETNE